MKKYRLPVFFLVASLTLDSIITEVKTWNDRSLEGDPIVVWLWQIFGSFKWLLPFLWLSLIGLVCWLLNKKGHTRTIYWLLYTIGLSHLIGFFSWTTPLPHLYFELMWYLDHNFSFLSLPYFLQFQEIIIISLVLGFVLAHLHLKIASKKRNLWPARFLIGPKV